MASFHTAPRRDPDPPPKLSEAHVLVAVWDTSDDGYTNRDTTFAVIGRESGSIAAELPMDGQRVATGRADGCVLLRDTNYASEPEPAYIVDSSGERVGSVELGRYDLFNHYFAIKNAEDLLVLVGRGSHGHLDKQVASVCRKTDGSWSVEMLYPLAWEAGRHLFGGPGVFVRDQVGAALIHAGAIHDGAGLLRDNAFVARRGHPDGQLIWDVRLDDTVTDLVLVRDLVVATTNMGDIVQINAFDGRLMASDRITVGGWPVVPLSMAVAGPGHVWIGTMDGRAILVDLRKF